MLTCLLSITCYNDVNFWWHACIFMILCWCVSHCSVQVCSLRSTQITTWCHLQLTTSIWTCCRSFIAGYGMVDKNHSSGQAVQENHFRQCLFPRTSGSTSNRARNYHDITWGAWHWKHHVGIFLRIADFNENRYEHSCERLIHIFLEMWIVCCEGHQYFSK